MQGSGDKAERKAFSIEIGSQRRIASVAR